MRARTHNGSVRLCAFMSRWAAAGCPGVNQSAERTCVPTLVPQLPLRVNRALLQQTRPGMGSDVSDREHECGPTLAEPKCVERNLGSVATCRAREMTEERQGIVRDS